VASVIPIPGSKGNQPSAGRRGLASLLLWSLVLFAAGLLAPWLLGDPTRIGGPTAAKAEIAGRVSVIDGDTIEIRGERIRLHGIDAPESGQLCQRGSGESYRCGQVAALALADRIGGQSVRCEILDRDRYDRHVGRCFAGETDLNGWMVRQGHAVAYRRYSLDYLAMETAARGERKGAWDGYFDLPWDWRSGDRRAEGGSSTAVWASRTGCDIKGNISANGKIYHLPGQQFYDRTAIDPAKGERWFCSEEEARAAGWRRALR
jgi:endonuclease YncB( thermonuclease family)